MTTRKQINLRTDSELTAIIVALQVALEAKIKLPMTMTDVVRLAVHELAERHNVKVELTEEQKKKPRRGRPPTSGQ